MILMQISTYMHTVLHALSANSPKHSPSKFSLSKIRLNCVASRLAQVLTCYSIQAKPLSFFGSPGIGNSLNVFHATCIVLLWEWPLSGKFASRRARGWSWKLQFGSHCNKDVRRKSSAVAASYHQRGSVSHEEGAAPKKTLPY